MVQTLLPWFCGFSVLVGAGFTAWGWRLVQRTREFQQAAESVEGLVSAVNTRHSDGSTFRYPVVEFVDRLGSPHSFTATLGMTSGCPEPGTRLMVLYDPANPDDARIDSFQYLWLFPVTILGMGVWGVICGPLVYVVAKFVE